MRLAALALLLAFPMLAFAGGGPETTLLVINADSPASLRVANEYARLRRIPATHFCFLENVPAGPVIDVNAFRERIEKPIREFLEAHGLAERIDLIAYSAGFPYAVDFGPDKAPPYAMGVSPLASLTSLTYLARRVEKKDADGYLDLKVNGYFRRYADEPGTRARRPTAEEDAAYREAMTALQAKKYQAAADAYGRLLSTFPEQADSWYNQACCLALLGKADAALAALGRAADHGFLDAAHTRADDDLTSVRARPEFAAIIKRMEAATAERESRTPAVQPAHGFTARGAWTGGDGPAVDAPADSPDRYRLAVMLAYSGERGNSVPEALSYLASAAASDGTQPSGTVYFLGNDDVRATTRRPLFAGAVAALRALGHAATIVSKSDPGQTGILPVGKADVLGAVVGIAGFSWAESKSRLLPGAIAEHLTSYGAMFNSGSQTKLTEFLRYGAAGSSGTVAEPYSIQMKFPVPHLHVYYAEGCSLAESFYQSVWGPYQLLIVGDPLARPFARFAEVTMIPLSVCTGAVDVKATVKPAAGRPIARIELWVDGGFFAEAQPDAAIAWDTTKVEDGGHELRMVAVEADRIETRSFALARVTVANGKNAVTIAGPKGPVAYGEPVALAGAAPGAKEIRILAGVREVASVPVKGGAWKAIVPSAMLGMGAVTLQARSVPSAGDSARSPFFDVTIDAPARRKPVKPAAAYQDGLKATITDTAGKPHEVVLASFDGPEVKTKAAGAKQALIEGEFEVSAAGVYELDLRTSGAVALEIDGKPALDAGKLSADRQTCALVALELGWHALKLKWVPDGSPELAVLLGGEQVTAPIAAKALRHGKK